MTLLPRLLAHLRPGGVLAIQMPRNFQAASHVTLRQVAAQEPWAARLAGVLQAEPVASPAWYHDLLAPQAAALDIWQTEYLHVLEGEDPVLRWTEATALRPVLQTLDEAAAAAFKAAYAARLREAYPRRPDGTTPVPVPAPVHRRTAGVGQATARFRATAARFCATMRTESRIGSV